MDEARQADAAYAAMQASRTRPGTQPVPLTPVSRPPERLPAPVVDRLDPERVNRVLAELDTLMGLESVADRVREMAERVRSDERRRHARLGTAEHGLHLVFSGPSGVGKTEVAGIWGRVLCAAGLLPHDRVTVVKREGLVAEHVGGTAAKTSAVIDRGDGGVLLIDEAYSLTPAVPGNDFGQEAITTLLARMEESRGQLAVIVAGYPAAASAARC